MNLRSTCDTKAMKGESQRTLRRDLTRPVSTAIADNLRHVAYTRIVSLRKIAGFAFFAPLREALLLLLLLACNQPFDPRASLDKKMVVFSVLSTDRKMQFVRVQLSYMSPTYDPLSFDSDNSVTDATVYLKASNGMYPLKDTLLPRADTSRYNFPLRAFVINPFVPKWGEAYEVIVQSVSYGLASASVIVPGKTEISIPPSVLELLDHPVNNIPSAQMTFIVKMSGISRGYIGRLLVYYDVLKGARWVEERVEVPVSSADSSNFSLDFAVYPRIHSTPSTSQVTLYYKNGYYKAVLDAVGSRYPRNQIVFKWATFVVLQADKNLFEYYSSFHTSMDPYSTRLDEPVVSPLDGALGVVGAYSLDSLVRLLPENFSGNH